MIDKNVYHGSNARFVEFTDKTKRIKEDLFGGGIAYFTDTYDVGERYAKAWQKRYGGFQFVYKVRMTLHECFDVNYEYTGETFLKIYQQTKYTPEEFARRAGLLIYGVNKYGIFGDIKSGRQKLTGAQLWKGLSNGGNENVKAQNVLKKCGFDGLRYNGGENTGKDIVTIKHDVYCPYYPDSIRILDVSEENPLHATEFK